MGRSRRTTDLFSPLQKEEHRFLEKWLAYADSKNDEVLSLLILIVGQAYQWYFSVSLSLARVCIQLKTVICSLWKNNLNVWWMYIFTVDLENTLEILMGFLVNHTNIQTHVLLMCPRVQVQVPSALPAWSLSYVNEPQCCAELNVSFLVHKAESEEKNGTLHRWGANANIKLL